MPTYEGFDVLEIEPNDTGDKAMEHTRSLVRLDSRTGALAVADRSGVAVLRNAPFVWTMDGRAEIQDCLDWIASRKGALVPFWVPTWRHDLVLSEALTSGVELTIVESGYTAHQFPHPARRHLAFILAGGAKYYRKVEDAQDNGDGTETLTIDSSIPETVPTTALVSFLTLCRLAVDDPEIVWHTKTVAEASLDFVELPLEVAALEEVGS